MSAPVLAHLKIEQTLANILGSEDEIQAVVTAVPDMQKGERLVVVHKPVTKTPEQICSEMAHAGLPHLWIPSPDSFVEIDAIPLLATGKPDLKSLKAFALKKIDRTRDGHAMRSSNSIDTSLSPELAKRGFLAGVHGADAGAANVCEDKAAH